MNIFVTDPSPIVSAYALDDVRVNKMIVESGQMLSTALWLHGVRDDRLYKAAFQHHPCTRWAAECYGNWLWLYIHMGSLLRVRGGDHKAAVLHKYLPKHAAALPSGAQTPFVNCSLFKDIPVINAYRKTMNYKWRHDRIPLSWVGRGKPGWYEP